MTGLLRCLCVVCTLAFFVASATAAPRFKKFGSLYGQRFSEPTDVSASGLVFVGTAYNRQENQRAVRREMGRAKFIEIGTLAGSTSEAWGVSADGSVVVGAAINAAGARRAFRWSTNSGMQELSLDQDWESLARGISGDGKVVVGWLATPLGRERPFRWTASGGTMELGTLGGNSGYANAANGDGRVIVGVAGDAEGVSRACRWVAEGGAEELGDLGGGHSEAHSVTQDGSVIVGVAEAGDGIFQAFRWTAVSGMQSLHTNVSFLHTGASDISADGTRIVGTATTDIEERGIIWTPQGGLQDMNVVYRSVLPRGWRYVSAAAISSDGRWIVGTAVSPRRGLKGYMLDTGASRQ